MKNKFILLLFFLLIPTLSGCYDEKEIDETAYIIALGIDKGEGENYSYTFQFSSPLSLSNSESGEGSSQESGEKQGKSGENSTVSNLVIDAPDFYIAKNMTNNFLSKNVDMSHLKLIVFSSQIDAGGVEDHSQLLLHEREVRPHTAIAVAATSAGKYIENVNPELESNTSKYYELMSLRSNNVYAPSKRLHDFVDDMTAKNSDSVLPIAVNGEELKNFPSDNSISGWMTPHNSQIASSHSVLSGMAIFKDGKLSGAMDGDSAMIFNILNRSIKDCTITVANQSAPDETLSFRLTVLEPASYNTDIENNSINISQSLQLEFLGLRLPQGYRSFDELYSYTQKVLTQRIQDFLNDISRTKKADILDIRNHLRLRFATWEEWNNFDWDNFYQKAKFSVNIDIA